MGIDRTSAVLMANVRHSKVVEKGFHTAWDYSLVIEPEHYAYLQKQCLGRTNTGRDIIRESIWVLTNE